jgi:hypothetical protein
MMKKKSQIENFIGIYDNYFSEEFCDNLITHFEWNQKTNRSYLRPEMESIKSDESTNLNPNTIQEINFMTPNISAYIGEFNDVFWNECYADYMKNYSVLTSYEPHTIYTYKIQKTLPGGGYHVWHSEDGSKQMSQRVGVYILYLNDVDEGGETEFLYLSKRVAAKKGRLVIFPPNYPWAHRGNPPLSGEKYILTGWMEFR